MKQVALADFRDHLSQYLVEAEEEQIVVTKHGKPAGVLTGFATDDDWFDFQLENDPRFLNKIEQSRASIRDGHGIPWEQVKKEDDERTGRSTVPRKARRRASRVR